MRVKNTLRHMLAMVADGIQAERIANASKSVESINMASVHRLRAGRAHSAPSSQPAAPCLRMTEIQPAVTLREASARK